MRDAPNLQQEVLICYIERGQLVIAGLRESLSVALELLSEAQRDLKRTQDRYYALLDERRRERREPKAAA